MKREREEIESLEVRSNYSAAMSRRSYFRKGSSRCSSRGEDDRLSNRLSIREVGR